MSLAIPTNTGWSTFWGESPNAYQMLFARATAERMIGAKLSPQASRELRAVMRALNGVAAGGTATAQWSRVKAQNTISDFDKTGGVVEIETFTAINRATTSDDQDYINNIIYDGVPNQQPSIPSGYPTDASGNGGGGKLGM